MGKRRAMVGMGVILALGGIALAAPGALKPNPPISAKSAIVAMSKIVDGSEKVVAERRFQCPNGPMTRQMDFAIETHMGPWQCDEPCSRETLNGTFLAKVRVIRRETPGQSHRGCFSGTWRLLSGSTLIASGTMNGTVYAGTHDGAGAAATCESCAPQFHFEGVLNGRSTGRCKGSICASIQGQGLDPQLPGFLMRVEGSLFTPYGTQVPGAADVGNCCSGAFVETTAPAKHESAGG